MARITTTIWDLAMAVGEQAEAATDDRDEAFDLAFCALANLLGQAKLEDLTADAPDPHSAALETELRAAS